MTRELFSFTTTSRDAPWLSGWLVGWQLVQRLNGPRDQCRACASDLGSGTTRGWVKLFCFTYMFSMFQHIQKYCIICCHTGRWLYIWLYHWMIWVGFTPILGPFFFFFSNWTTWDVSLRILIFFYVEMDVIFSYLFNLHGKLENHPGYIHRCSYIEHLDFHGIDGPSLW